jgi:triphosphoribosyl-dephospho-CoA synthase
MALKTRLRRPDHRDETTPRVKPVAARAAATVVATAREIDPWAVELSASAVATLIEVSELTPKPALVDRRGSGAHRDLDLARVQASAEALRSGFATLAQAAAAERPSERLRENLGRIGRDMERRVMAPSLQRWVRRSSRS